MDKVKPLWDRNADVSPSLRLPKSSPTEFLGREASRANPEPKNNALQYSVDEIIAKSTLKVDAPEWYPSSSRNSQYTASNSIRSSHNAQYVPPNGMYEIQEDSPDIIRLKQIINTLTKDPGQFDNLLDLFMETIQPYFEDIVALSIIAQLLVETAITNSNFRYTSARLCWFIEQNSPNFRAELHLKCKKALEENFNKQSVLLFIAEVYTQLPHLKIYGALLIDCFKQLFNRGGNDNIKCICQALKLTGYSLEQSNKTELDEVFTHLKMAKEGVSGSVINLLDSVINLRSSNWGYSNEAPASSEQQHPEFYYEDVQSTTFYRNDGDSFTNEEKEFLTAHLDSNIEYLSDSSDPDELYDPEPEMDEEIQAAFKEFLQLSKH